MNSGAGGAMTLTFVDVLFLVSTFLPPAVVVVCAALLLAPARKRERKVVTMRAHAH